MNNYSKHIVCLPDDKINSDILGQYTSLLNYYIQKTMRETEDKIIREMLHSMPGKLDENDPSIIAYDKDMRGLTAKDLMEIYPDHCNQGES